jgi:hypothetical protein
LLLSEIEIHYKNCSTDDVHLLEKFEAEIRKAAARKGLTRDVCWEPYMAHGRQWFELYTDDEQQHFLGGDFGRAFLDRVSQEEFFDWLIHLRDFAEPTAHQ